jgi:hypothetical protein
VRPANSTIDLPTTRRSWWLRPVDAAVWPVATGLCAGAAAAIGFVLASAFLGQLIQVSDENDLALVVKVCCPLGAVGGLLVGVVVGLLLGQHQRAASVVLLALFGTLLGAAGGYLGPHAVYLLSGMLPVIAGHTLIWGIMGTIAGGLAYPIARALNEPPEAAVDDEPGPSRLPATSASRQPPPGGRTPHRGTFWRTLPALAATGYALIAAVLTSSSTTAQILLGIGLLGLAHVYQVVHLEARLNRLERPLR